MCIRDIRGLILSFDRQCVQVRCIKKTRHVSFNGVIIEIAPLPANWYKFYDGGFLSPKRWRLNFEAYRFLRRFE